MVTTTAPLVSLVYIIFILSIGLVVLKLFCPQIFPNDSRVSLPRYRTGDNASRLTYTTVTILPTAPSLNSLTRTDSPPSYEHIFRDHK